MTKAHHPSNRLHKQAIIDQFYSYFKNDIAHKNITVLGLAFKANTDDIGESPALDAISRLTRDGDIHVTLLYPVSHKPLIRTQP
jgi:UDP-glucose 6-dehydrogenase